MCGVFGFVRNESLLIGDDDLISRHKSSLLHRGPDFSKHLIIGQKCILGNTRLSVIDLSSSPQPMKCNCSNHYMTFNGEIYNYAEIRESLNYEFSTSGDAEVLLALLCLEGFSALNKVRGQFAVALWNSKTEELSLAVDFFGILPMYVNDSPEGVTFSSSTTILAESSKSLGKSSLAKLLTSRSINAPETCYSQIERVGPGEVWTYSKQIQVRSKWALQLPVTENFKPETGLLVKLLNQAADRAITSDVEIGIFLSGGIDSAVAAKLIQDRVPYKLRAYTAFWPEQSKENEMISSQQTAADLGLHHTLVEVTPSEWWRGMQEGTCFRDGPMSEPADSVMYLLSEVASKDVKVICTGDGIDELFGGYKKYKVEFWANKNVPQFLLQASNSIPRKFLSERTERLIFAAGQKIPSERFPAYFDTFWGEISFGRPSRLWNTDDDLGVLGLREWDMRHYLTSTLLDRADRMTMSHSLESRPIFLDVDLVKYALNLKEQK